MKEEPGEDIPFALYQQQQKCQGETDVESSYTIPSFTPSLDQQPGQGEQVYWPYKEFLPGADAANSPCSKWMYSSKPVPLPSLLACPQHLDLYSCILRLNPLYPALGVPSLPLDPKTSGPVLGSTDDPSLTADYVRGKKKTESEPGTLDPVMEVVQRSPSPPASHASLAPIPINMKLPLSLYPLCPSCPFVLPIKPLSPPKTCLSDYGPQYPHLFLPSLATPYLGMADKMMPPDGPYSHGAHSPLQLETLQTLSSPLPDGLWASTEARNKSSSPSQCCSTGFNSEAVAGKAGRIPSLGTADLLYPLKTENGTILYKCNICAKSFRQLSNLKVHFRVHSGERPFQCPLCQKSFIQMAHLQKHQLVHSGERPYQCSVCHRCFSSNSSLKSHLRLHSGARPFLYRLGPKEGNESTRHPQL